MSRFADSPAGHVVAIVIGASLAVACASALSAADRAAIADDAANIARCQNVGRACKADGGVDCYAAYAACMSDAGLH